MLKIIQSQRIESLFDEMLAFFDEHPIGVFEPRQILIPSHGVGVWLKLHLASTQGIVAQVSTDFLGAFQWDLYGRLATRDAEQKLINGVPQAPLSASIMRWQIFAYIWQVYSQAFSTQDNQKNTQLEKDTAAIDALNFLLKKIVSQQHHSHQLSQQADNDAEVKRTIWVLSSQIAQVFAGYVTYRADWLRLWGRGEFLDLKVLCKDKPEWLIERFSEMQVWQAWLWKSLFTPVFDQREAEVARFWSALKTDPSLVKKLPRSVTIFTVIQLPPAELMFLRQLAQYVDVALLHYNPSQEYWADLVDARWLRRRMSEQGDGVELRETHPLLTRMGKQSRDVFKLLVQLSGGEFVEGESFQEEHVLSVQESWQDAFVQDESEQSPTVLQHIQQHALDLSNVKNWNFDPADGSLAIHACHSTLRQLEVLREELIQWLGADVTGTERRKPSDILVLVPDLNDVAPLIRAVFPSTLSYDSHAEIHIPIEITGLTSPEVDALWQALTGRFNLLAGRLSCETLLDWLALLPVQQSYGLSVDQVTRMGELLVEAGFRRGFDGEHLSRTLLSHDADVRFTLRFALDRLILGMAMPVDTMYVDCLPMTTLMRDDFELIAVLEQIYQELHQHREQLLLQRSVSDWLAMLRAELQFAFASERDTRGWTSIIQALDDMEKNANAALVAQSHVNENELAANEIVLNKVVPPDIQLPLRFVLEELQTTSTQAMQSSIPTGSVTFARLGTMRPLPYRLIAVLNLDTGKFPKREQKNTFDLIGALPPVIGDRARTEDDLGAFLDALLLASDACWLFYNGRDVQDDQPRLPAAPVQELMDFLRDHLAKEIDVDDQQKTVSPLDRYIHHSHTLLPFERENFNAAHPQAAAGVWFEVAKRLNEEQKMHSPAWILPSVTPIYSVPENPIKADQWIKDLMQPARHFLAHARIGRLYLEEGLSPFEPLTLNKLDEYQLRHQFQLSKQNQKSLQSTQWVAALPVGVAGAAYWKKSEREQVVIEQRMQQYGGVVTPITERLLTVPDARLLDDQVVQNWQLSIRVPTDEKATMWLSQSASSGKGRHRVRFWLEHLLWQVWRATTEDDVVQGRGYRIAVYSTQTLKALPIAAGDALKHVQNWLHVWQMAAQQPFVLPPSLTLEAFSVDKKTDELKIKSFDTLSVKWLGNDFNSYIPPNQNEECALHPDWQLILQGQDVEEAYAHFFSLYAETLYEPIVRNVLEEDDIAQEKAE
jgi:exodeoxyribonuclease V gamma subunit